MRFRRTEAPYGAESRPRRPHPVAHRGVLLGASLVAGLATLPLLWNSAERPLQLLAAAACATAAVLAGHAGARRRVPVLRDLRTVLDFADQHDLPLALYLRRFAQDAASPELEQQIALGLGQHAFFLAIGRPGERLPTEGAFRLYVDDAHWREVVGTLLDRANLVIMRWTVGGQLEWELQRVCESGTLQHTAFVLPPNADTAGHLPDTLRDKVNADTVRKATRSAPALVAHAGSDTVTLLHAAALADRQPALEELTRTLAERQLKTRLNGAQRSALRRLYGRPERFALALGSIAVIVPTLVVVLVAVLLTDSLLPIDIIPAALDLDHLMTWLGGLLLGSVVVAAVLAPVVSRLNGRS